MSTIIDLVLRVNQPNAGDPVPGVLCVLRVRIVIGVSGESRSEVEEAPVRDGVLVIVTAEPLVDLPA